MTEAARLAELTTQALAKLASFTPAVGDRIFHWADLDRINWTDGKGWTDGFWTGQLWLAYETTGDAAWKEAALKSHFRFQQRLARPETHDHDLGFLFSLSAIPACLAGGVVEGRDMAIAAARSLASRLNTKGQFIRAWNDWPDDTLDFRQEKRGKAIIDCMMNLPLLWWAAKETGDQTLADAAYAHARTSALHFFRPDGSTYHTFNFDAETGAPLGGRTFQGYAHESCWSRGQAWALYGFTLAYTCTGLPEYLETARKAAAFWLRRTPANGVPPWDFDTPSHRAPVDTSAGAIAACGLLELARHTGGAEGERYHAFATKALVTLGQQYAQPAPHFGLITGGTSFLPAGQGIHVSLNYGDYFYLEGLLRAGGRTSFYWFPLAQG